MRTVRKLPSRPVNTPNKPRHKRCFSLHPTSSRSIPPYPARSPHLPGGIVVAEVDDVYACRHLVTCLRVREHQPHSCRARLCVKASEPGFGKPYGIEISGDTLSAGAFSMLLIVGIMVADALSVSALAIMSAAIGIDPDRMDMREHGEVAGDYLRMRREGELILSRMLADFTFGAAAAAPDRPR